MRLSTVTITDAVSIAASTKQFTAYLITVGDSDGARWSIRRRYSAFQALHKSLTESYPVVPALPGWSILPGSDSFKSSEDAFLQTLGSGGISEPQRGPTGGSLIIYRARQ